jgi:hypothetical protein
MTTQKSLIKPMMLLSLGILLVVSPLLINNFIRIPDFLRGLLMGVGIVSEITALVMLINVNNKNKRAQAGSK